MLPKEKRQRKNECFMLHEIKVLIIFYAHMNEIPIPPSRTHALKMMLRSSGKIVC